jgi:Leucine-rich repeat (LRR) protein
MLVKSSQYSSYHKMLDPTDFLSKIQTLKSIVNHIPFGMTCCIQNDAFATMSQLKSLDLTVFNFEKYELIKESFHGLENIEYLNLNKCCFLNEEENKQNKVFSNLINLKQMNIVVENNINRNIFNGLFNLVELNLNYHSNFDADYVSFDGLVNLKILKIKLFNVKTNHFKVLTNLNELWLNYMTIQKDGFFGLKNLLRLDLSYNQSKSLESNIFNGLINLKELNLEGSKFTFIQKDAFKGLSNLEHLNMKLLEINDNLDENIFADFKSKLKILNLESFSFNHSNNNPFSCFDRLETICLTNCSMLEEFISSDFLNKIKSISILTKEFLNAIIFISNLKLFNLKNLIVKYSVKEKTIDVHSTMSITQLLIENNTFDGFEQLESIKLNGFPNFIMINNFQPLSFSKLIYLKHLNLSDNQIIFTDQYNNLFTNLKSLYYLNLSRNELFDVDCQFFNGLENLKHLDLSQTKVIFKDKLLENLSNLEILNLSYTKFNITELNESVFYGLTNLKELFLCENDEFEKQISSKTFQKTLNLIHLDLTKFSVKTIDIETFNCLKKLEILNLCLNRIEEMDENHFIGLNRLKQLNLYGNLFIYQTDISQFYTKLNIKNLDLIVV